MQSPIRVHTASVVGLILVLASGVGLSQTQKPAAPPTHVVVPASQVKFDPIDVPGFDSGMKIAVIYGDPNAQTGSYVIRLAFPDGYRFPPHWHPMAENVTVLEGKFSLGMGATRDDKKLAVYSPGAFAHIAPRSPHFGGATGATVIQLHGSAPFKIELAKPAGK